MIIDFDKILDDIKALRLKKKWACNIAYWDTSDHNDIMLCIDITRDSQFYFKQYHKMNEKQYPTHIDKLNKINWWIIEHIVKELGYNKEFIKKIAFFYEMSDKDCMDLNIPDCNNINPITFDKQTFTNCLAYYV